MKARKTRAITVTVKDGSIAGLKTAVVQQEGARRTYAAARAGDGMRSARDRAVSAALHGFAGERFGKITWRTRESTTTYEYTDSKGIAHPVHVVEVTP